MGSVLCPPTEASPVSASALVLPGRTSSSQEASWSGNWLSAAPGHGHQGTPGESGLSRGLHRTSAPVNTSWSPLLVKSRLWGPEGAGTLHPQG